MKSITVLSAILILSAAVGCQTKKVAISESIGVSVSDTTKAEADSLTIWHAEQTRESENLISEYKETDTTKITKASEESIVIDFVDGGGTVSIDTAGSLIIDGVKSIKADIRLHQAKQGGIMQDRKETLAERTETTKNGVLTNVHGKQENGIAGDWQKYTQQETEKEPERRRWYQALLESVGSLCCIAALLWLLFLYLKRKF